MLSRLTSAVCVVLAFGASGGSAHAAQANPPWPAACPLKFGILIDQSSSMSGRFTEVREAARNVVDALRDKNSEMTIIGFGTDAVVVESGVDVSDESDRQDLKSRIDDLTTNSGNEGGTNWEAAFAAAAGLDLDVVVLVTDGEPSVSGVPARQSDGVAALSAAALAADRLKEGGTRVVGIGIDLSQNGAANLAGVTGPEAGQDYFSSDTTALLRQLYGVVASSCGVAITALPTPEPRPFPLLETLVAALALLVLAALVGYVLHRRRNRGQEPRPVVARARPGPVADTAIKHDEIAEALGIGRASKPKPSPPEERPAPPRRQLSLDFLPGERGDQGPPADR